MCLLWGRLTEQVLSIGDYDLILTKQCDGRLLFPSFRLASQKLSDWPKFTHITWGDSWIQTQAWNTPKATLPVLHASPFSILAVSNKEMVTSPGAVLLVRDWWLWRWMISCAPWGLPSVSPHLRPGLHHPWGMRSRVHIPAEAKCP